MTTVGDWSTCSLLSATTGNKQTKKVVTLKFKTNFKTKTYIFPRPDGEKAYSHFQRELRRRPSHTASRVLCKAMANMQLVSGQLPQVWHSQEADYRLPLLHFLLCHDIISQNLWTKKNHYSSEATYNFNCTLFWVGSLKKGDALEEEMATHSGILAWKIPCTEEPGRLQVHGVTKSQTALSNWAHTHPLRGHHSCACKKALSI